MKKTLFSTVGLLLAASLFLAPVHVNAGLPAPPVPPVPPPPPLILPPVPPPPVVVAPAPAVEVEAGHKSKPGKKKKKHHDNGNHYGQKHKHHGD